MKKDINISYRDRNRGTGKAPNWQYIISYKTSGQWKQKSKQGFAKKKDCKEAATERAEKLMEQYHVLEQSTAMTFEEVFEAMLRDKPRADNTVSTYRNTFKSYGDLREKDISEISYLDVLTVIREEEQKRKGTGTKLLKAVGKMVFTYAIRKLRIVATNPFDEIELEKKPASFERKALTPAEIRKVLDSLPGDIRLLCAFIGLAGLRIGEARALTASDIDLKGRTIKIDKQLLSTGLEGAPKTASGYRTVPMGQTLYDTYTSQPIRIGSIYEKIPYQVIVNRLLAEHGIRSHDLRHSYATNCISAGLDFKTVATLLGDKVETLMSTYAHVNTDMTEQAKKVLESF